MGSSLHSSFRRRPESIDAVRQRHDELGQRGSAMVYIFIGIALFGMLLFIMSRSNNQSTTALTDQQASIAASDILNFSKAVATSVNRVLANGCSETQISFENSFISGYTNPNAPSDKHCHIFNKAGGKVTIRQHRDWQVAREEVVSKSSYVTYWDRYPGWAFIGLNNYVDNGSTKADLHLFVPFIPKKTCENINKLLKGTSVIPSGAGNFHSLFVGNFAEPPESQVSSLVTASAGCVQVSGLYFFLKILIAR